MRASDFRSTFERDFETGTPVPGYYEGIVGATRCEKLKRPQRCDLSHGIVADDVAKTVTFHLVAADPEFLYKLALAFAYVVPAGTPPPKGTTHPLPATGPYMIASYRPKHVLTLVRNPYFHEWSKAAQPDGYPDKIVFEIGGTPDEAVDAVIRGKADAFSTSQSETPPSESRLAAITTQHASQVHTNPQPATVALFLNTRLAPFNQSRRAQGAELRRGSRRSGQGGRRADVAQPTCQILPPHFPGYRPYCPYTAGTTAQGRWTAPDLAKARALIARSGTRGMKITFWSWSDLGRPRPVHGEASPVAGLSRVDEGPRRRRLLPGRQATRAPRRRSGRPSGSPTIPRLPASSTPSSPALRSYPTTRGTRTTRSSATRASTGRSSEP